MKTNKIILYGLGKLGLPLSLIFSQKIYVKGIDIDKNKVQNLNLSVVPFFEPQLNEYLKSSKENITFYDSENYDLDDVDIAVILVNTPSNENGEFSNQYIYDVLNSLCDKLEKSDKKDFLIILSSTVMPGSCSEIIEYIETKSKRTLNESFGFAYIPDLVALGSVIKDFENPDLLILGSSEKRYGDLAETLYKKIIKNDAPIVRMSLIESEITKVSLNAYITMKISFANFIGNVSEKFNCNPNNITKALGYDKRISPYYIKSGVSFGGTCFPRDTWAFIKMSESIGLDAIHIKATQKINEQQNINLLNKLANFKNKKIGILGLSFKPNTMVTTESAGLILYESLKKLNYNVYGCDELVETDFNYNNISVFFEKCDVIVLLHDNKKYLTENLEILETKILINPWNINF
jgi:UDPglucose 6-dehydrogenase